MRFLTKSKKRDTTIDKDLNFPSFDYSAQQLSCYIYALEIFIISLKNCDVIRYDTERSREFLHWLTDHKIRNVTKLIKERAHSKN